MELQYLKVAEIKPKIISELQKIPLFVLSAPPTIKKQLEKNPSPKKNMGDGAQKPKTRVYKLPPLKYQ